MHGMRHSRRAPSGRGLLLLSSLAVLAFACFPVFAQADSTGVQYNPGLPEGGHHHQHEPVAKSSTEPPSGGTSSPTEQSSPAPSEVNSGEVPSEEVQAGSNGGPEGHQRSPEGAKSGAGKPKATSPARPHANASPETGNDGGGGSSPLVPILIALAVLAAISVGAYVLRQRRGGSGGVPTPRAG
jgi:hypothetical protein